MNPEKKRIAVFCSGEGTNFKALVKSVSEKELNAEIVLCLSNRSNCGAMKFARENGIEAQHLSENQFESHEAFSDAMLDELKSRGVEIVCLAGYLKKVPKKVVEAYPKRMLNIHPALLPKFGGEGMYGINVHRAVIAAGEVESGATVHFVDEEYDSGANLIQEIVPVQKDDTPESLAKAVLCIEHQIYPTALQLLLKMIEEEESVSSESK
ncbi:phosphoribosylglycinamide formyltransferase [Chloroherpeton thalassium ATCC 35110]|uniref:Phosphoribosylglycinamide formyltransferase n=1 Tax=Chloroherpeton thalassium (strain ATCC 35110 / GB-78) TaxID=517418 RepID=B3QS63_CHLT3|nr:phosphoribosylglycinamide formyltransferase [Chloroherpeton thalassium]ACF14008.1 phosphoribosylglycinamide formyltransferase [Chloroherpeton thalassium ATCC 35110]